METGDWPALVNAVLFNCIFTHWTLSSLSSTLTLCNPHFSVTWPTYHLGGQTLLLTVFCSGQSVNAGQKCFFEEKLNFGLVIHNLLSQRGVGDIYMHLEENRSPHLLPRWKLSKYSNKGLQYCFCPPGGQSICDFWPLKIVLPRNGIQRTMNKLAF